MQMFMFKLFLSCALFLSQVVRVFFQIVDCENRFSWVMGSGIFIWSIEVCSLHFSAALCTTVVIAGHENSSWFSFSLVMIFL